MSKCKHCGDELDQNNWLVPDGPDECKRCSGIRSKRLDIAVAALQGKLGSWLRLTPEQVAECVTMADQLIAELCRRKA